MVPKHSHDPLIKKRNRNVKHFVTHHPRRRLKARLPDLTLCALYVGAWRSRELILSLTTDGHSVICLLIYLCIPLCIDLIVSWKNCVLNYGGLSRCCALNYAGADLPWLLNSKLRTSLPVRLWEKAAEAPGDSLRARIFAITWRGLTSFIGIAFLSLHKKQ